MHGGRAQEGAFDLIGEVRLGTGDKGHLRLGQLGKDLEVGEAQVKDQQAAWPQRGQNLGPEALVVRCGIRFVPDAAWQMRAQIQQGQHPSRQWRRVCLRQQANLAQERIQR